MIDLAPRLITGPIMQRLWRVLNPLNVLSPIMTTLFGIVITSTNFLQKSDSHSR